MMTDREKFCTLLANGPLMSADAIVVLAGEDGVARAKTAVELFRQGAAPVVVLTGGLSDECRLSAEDLIPDVLGGGVAPDRVFTDTTATNTHEQAEKVAALCAEHNWRRVLLVVSAYHMPRAFLTCLNSLQAAESDDVVRLVAVPCAHTPWWGKPPGAQANRVDLLDAEMVKCETYTAHVASWADGLAYLRQWERR